MRSLLMELKKVRAWAYIKDEELNKGMKKKIMIKNCITMSSCVGKWKTCEMHHIFIFIYIFIY